MRANDFRRMALGMKGAVEGAHMDHPDFRVNNRIFATLHHDRAFGMVRLTPDQQEQFMRAHGQADKEEVEELRTAILLEKAHYGSQALSLA